MYQVYAQQRPGRPLWALAAGALLLLLTVAMAWALIRMKTRRRDVPLGESQVIQAGRLSARLPHGWEPIPDDVLRPTGALIGMVEPSADGLSGRYLFLFRRPTDTLSRPSTNARVALERMAAILCPGGLIGFEEKLPGRIGPWPAWTLLASGPSSISRDIRLRHCLGRAAILPSGEVIGVTLLLPQNPRRADDQLLEKISNHLIPLDVTIGVNLEAQMNNAGINFEPPAEVRALVLTDPDLPQLRISGGDDTTFWYLDIYRLPLIGSRTPQELVEDHALSVLQRGALPGEIETTIINDRRSARIMLPISSKVEPTMILWSVQTDPRTALFMVGRFETKGEPIIRDICQSIAGSAEVTPYEERLDIAAAQETARKWLSQIAGQGLASMWSRPLETEQVREIRAPGMVLGYEERVCRPSRQKNLVWDISSTTTRKLLLTISYETEERWLIRDDTNEHVQTVRETLLKRLDKEVEMTYYEGRSAEAEYVQRKLELGSGETTLTNPAIDDTYGCEPVLLCAAAKVAGDPEKRAAIFSTTEVYPRQTVYWIMVPVGERPLPGLPQTESANAVLLQRDYRPSPITLYYDNQEILLAAKFEGGTWKELVKNKSGDQRTESMFRRAQ